MKYEVYRCDKCNAILSDPVQQIAQTHLSINFESHSGWVYKQDDRDHWYHSSGASGIKQFCGGPCIAGYFNEILKPVR